MLLDPVRHHLTVGQVLVGIVVLFFVQYYLTGFIRDRRIKKLGGFAPRRRTYWPLGVDFVYQSVKWALRNRQYEIFQQVEQEVAVPECTDNPHTIELVTLGRRILMTSDPENIKAILATQFNDYGKGEKFHQEWEEFLGDSIFATDHELWHNSRQLLRPQFIKDRVADLKIFDEHVSILLDKFSTGGATVDAMDLLYRFTLDTSTHFILGTSTDSLNGHALEFAEAFNEVQLTQSIISRSGPANWLVPRRKFRKNLKIMNELIQPYIERALRLSPEELEKRTKTDSEYTFLHALAGYTRDRKVLRDQMVAVLLAGRDTTACTLAWLLLEISKKPQIFTKLRTEVLERVGPSKEPTYADLKALRYLTHCINETLRIYPIVPFNVRMALKDTTLPRGGGPDGNQPVGILAGQAVGYSVLSMQRRADIYPDPSTGFPHHLEFVPERWETWTPKAWTYIPFNGGPRICIGQQFALTEMQYTMVRLLQRFDSIECREPPEALATQYWKGKPVDHPEWQANIVLQPAEGVRVAFHEAGEKN